MNITPEQIKTLRDQTGVSMMQCREALLKAEGDMEKALGFLREKSADIAAKKADRALGSGIVVSYVHGGAIGVLVKLQCETDFVARNPEFKTLAEDIALHVSAMNPLYLSEKHVPVGVDPESVREQLLLTQPFIKNPSETVGQVVQSAIQKFGENIELGGFSVLTLQS